MSFPQPISVKAIRPSKKLGRIKRILLSFLITSLLLVAFLLSAFVWLQFHPSKSIAVVGPEGPKHRAFIENRSFLDVCFVLCVVDWPHTFIKPISLASVPCSEGPNCRIFWSKDGSVIIAHDSDAAVDDTTGLTAVYDYKNHELIEYDTKRMQELIWARGGFGMEHKDYPDALDWDSR
jgi:hypothetical protein